MVSRADVERLRTEADTILTRYETVQAALRSARSESGDHWEDRTLELALDTPEGESIDVALDLDEDPASNARARYDRAAELAATLRRRESVVDQFDPLPADPLATLICHHLDAVEGNYPRSMAGHLDADRDHVEALCEEMEETGLLERVESGTVKQRRVKAKKADEVRQHHTYYRLSREGDHLLRFLSTREGKENLLRHFPDCRRIAERLADDGPKSPRISADDLGIEFEAARHCYRALRRVGLVVEADADAVPEDRGSGGNSTFYATTPVAEELLEDGGD